MVNIYGVKLKQDEWDKVEKEFLASFSGYFTELHDSIQLLRKNKENPLIRSQACLAFIAVDTFSRFQKIFQGETDKKKLNEDNEKRFKSWLDEFVFTSKNEFYKKHKDKIRCDAGVVWKLRNSFIHFYSFPEIKMGQKMVGFSFNVQKDECQRVEKAVKEKTGKQLVLVDIHCLIEVIFRGMLLQLEGLAKMIGDDPEKYVDLVIFAHRIIMQEGVSTIKMNN